MASGHEKLEMKSTWGFDVEGMDRRVRPQDDFFSYANGTWIRETPIPGEESSWGTFNVLRLETDKRVRTILEELAADRHPAGTREQQLGDFYGSAIDMERRDALGMEPLAIDRDAIRSLKSKEEVIPLMAQMEERGVSLLWGVEVMEDFKKTDQNALYLVNAPVGLPDRDYYLKDDPESLRIRTAYVEYIRKMAALAGLDPERTVTLIMSVETRLARASLDKVARRDPHAIYNKMSLAELSERAPGIEWGQYVDLVGASGVDTLIAIEPTLFTEAAAVCSELSLEDLKAYFEWRLIAKAASQLSSDFIETNFDFYGRVLSGATAMRPLWQRGVGVVNAYVGELMGQLYVERHFPPEAKMKAEEILSDIVEAYTARVHALSWMSPESKAKALEKVTRMDYKIGFPDKWKTYKGLGIVAGDHYGNVARTFHYEHRRQMAKLGQPVDRTEWGMNPQEVNAYYSPPRNEMVFPAGYLQWPFFDMQSDDALNYAAFGSTVGHEGSHGNDDEGSKFDAYGNLGETWTSEDRKRFTALAERLAAQYDEYAVADGLYVNGHLTLGENIADLGGLAIAYDAYQNHLSKNPEERRDINGLSPEMRFFLAWAQAERTVMRPEFEKMLVLTNPHSPSKYRVNGPLSNFKPFYDLFELTEGDALWRPEHQRVEIW